ncbi:MAG: MFS transporter [Bacillota bacterium]
MQTPTGRIPSTIAGVGRGALAFVARQRWNFKIVALRRALGDFATGLTEQYQSIYIVALGADPVQLGSVNSVGSAVGALIAVPLGWMADRYSPRGIFIFGSLLLVFSPLLYAVAPTWQFVIVAMLVHSVAFRFLHTGCQVICAESLKDADRATGKSACGTGASVLHLLGIAVAPFLITAFGGLKVEGIRPLYWVQFAVYTGTLLLLVTRLRRTPLSAESQAGGTLLGGIREVFAGGAALKRWIAVFTLSQMSMTLVAPFTQLFAHQVKGADQYVLAGRATAASLVGLVVGIPLGLLADRIGRKRVLYMIAPLYWAALVLLILAPTPGILIFSGVLQGFWRASFLISSAMTAEMVPIKHMGRWTGIITLFGGLISTPAPILGGIMWERLGPASVFIAAVAIDALVRIPLLTTIPETLARGKPR